MMGVEWFAISSFIALSYGAGFDTVVVRPTILSVCSAWCGFVLETGLSSIGFSYTALFFLRPSILQLLHHRSSLRPHEPMILTFSPFHASELMRSFTTFQSCSIDSTIAGLEFGIWIARFSSLERVINWMVIIARPTGCTCSIDAIWREILCRLDGNMLGGEIQCF